MSNLYMSRNESNTRYNINNVITLALKANKTLRLCDKRIREWFNSIPASTRRLLLQACEYHNIEIVY